MSTPLRDNRARARHILLLFYVYFAVMLLSIGVNLWQISLLQAEQPLDLDAINLSDTIQKLISYANIVLLCTGAILFIRWFRRAYYNLHIVNPGAASLQDGWAAGAWFVPFLNLVRPYTIMKELWNGTPAAYAGQFRTQLPATLPGVWWGLWIVANISSNIANRMTAGSTTTEAFIQALVADSIAILLMLGAMGAAIAMIRVYSKLEEELMEYSIQPSNSIFSVYQPLAPAPADTTPPEIID